MRRNTRNKYLQIGTFFSHFIGVNARSIATLVRGSICAMQ
jgi:hypothetical protein